MKKRVFIIHGWGSGPRDNWFSWLKFELENQNFDVVVPQMPNTDFPQQEQWVEHLKEIVGCANENTFFVTHSLGGIAVFAFSGNNY